MLRYTASVPAPGSFLIKKKKIYMLGKINQELTANVYVISFCQYRTHLPSYTDSPVWALKLDIHFSLSPFNDSFV